MAKKNTQQPKNYLQSIIDKNFSEDAISDFNYSYFNGDIELFDYQQQAVKNFVSSYKAEIEEQKIQNSTGINLAGLIKLYSSLAGEKKQSFNGVFSYVMRALFPYIRDEIPDVTGAIIAGNINQARQRYGVANLNNYIKLKSSKVLYY